MSIVNSLGSMLTRKVRGGQHTTWEMMRLAASAAMQMILL